MVEGEAETARNEANDLRKELEKTLWGCKAESSKVERLEEEVKQLELQLLERSRWSRILSKQRLNWKFTKLLQLRGINGRKNKDS